MKLTIPTYLIKWAAGIFSTLITAFILNMYNTAQQNHADRLKHDEQVDRAIQMYRWKLRRDSVDIDFIEKKLRIK